MLGLVGGFEGLVGGLFGVGFNGLNVGCEFEDGGFVIGDAVAGVWPFGGGPELIDEKMKGAGCAGVLDTTFGFENISDEQHTFGSVLS